jgi:hypothetical protein
MNGDIRVDNTDAIVAQMETLKTIVDISFSDGVSIILMATIPMKMKFKSLVADDTIL